MADVQTPERRTRSRPGSSVFPSDPPVATTQRTKERSRTTECLKVTPSPGSQDPAFMPSAEMKSRSTYVCVSVVIELRDSQWLLTGVG